VIIQTLMKLLIEPRRTARGKRKAVPTPSTPAPAGGQPPADLRYAVPKPTARRSARLHPLGNT
jgi:hypothetical protein